MINTVNIPVLFTFIQKNIYFFSVYVDDYLKFLFGSRIGAILPERPILKEQPLVTLRSLGNIPCLTSGSDALLPAVPASVRVGAADGVAAGRRQQVVG